jgi:hypothetical protein
MADKCFPLIRGRALRATRLDGCGNPLPGPRSVVVTKGFISVALTPNTEEGTPISVENANGEICVSDTPAPRLTGYGVALTLCGVDPALVNLLTGQPIVYNDAAVPEAVGFRVNTGINLDDSGFALEVWTGTPSTACEPGQTSAFGYLLLPFLKGGVLGDLTVENGPVNFSITGAQTKDGSNWGVGPWNVVRDSAGDAVPLLKPIDTKDHLNLEVTSVPPPVDQCGGQPLGTLATGASAGSPGTLTPANSYAPDTFEDLETDPLTASPSTAWGTGQYIVLGDGSKAYWDGTAWEEGEAP